MATSTLSFTPHEIELLLHVIDRRKRVYESELTKRDGLGEKFYRKELKRVDKVREECQHSLARLSPMDRAKLMGCVNETHVRPLEDNWKITGEMRIPEWYMYVKANMEAVRHEQAVLSLWNKLETRKAEKYTLPLERWERLDRLRTTVRVHCSFSGIKPYKLAMVLADGTVYRIKPDGGDLDGPLRYTGTELREIYTHELRPVAFCKALKRHGEDTRLNPWQGLILELLGNPVEQLPELAEV